MATRRKDGTMLKNIIALLEMLDERQLRIVYFFIKGLL